MSRARKQKTEMNSNSLGVVLSPGGSAVAEAQWSDSRSWRNAWLLPVKRFSPIRGQWKKGLKERRFGGFPLEPFPSLNGVFSRNGSQRSRARSCCAAKRTLEGEDRSEILVQEGKVWPRMDRQNGPVSRRR